MNHEAQTVPVISTAHITKSVADRLLADGGLWCSCATYPTYPGNGFLLFFDGPYGTETGAVPQCLLDIHDWCRKLVRGGEQEHRHWVRLESDAVAVKGLPTYER